jgi:hypothetical protein
MTAAAIAPVARGAFATVNPATGEQIETFTFYDAVKTEKTLAPPQRASSHSESSRRSNERNFSSSLVRLCARTKRSSPR